MQVMCSTVSSSNGTGAKSRKYVGPGCFPSPSSVKKRFAGHVSGWLCKWLKNLKLSSNFVDFKQAIIPAGDCFNEEWFFAMNIEGISHRETSNFLKRATSATSNKGISERVTSAFLQRATSDFLQQATSATSNEQILQRVMSDFLQQATSATSNEPILQRVTSDFLQRATSATSNEWFFATSNFCKE